jgi:hypothetical protein
MASLRLLSAAAAGAVVAVAAGAAAAPRLWRRLRAGDGEPWEDDVEWQDEDYLSDFDDPSPDAEWSPTASVVTDPPLAADPPPEEPYVSAAVTPGEVVDDAATFGEDEPTDEGGQGEILREELRDRLTDLQPAAPPPTVEAAEASGDVATDAARERLRARADEAREAFRKPVE